MAEDPKKPCSREDEIKVGPSVGDDARLFVRHTADHHQVLGVMRPVREGEPLTGNVFTVEPKDPANGVYKVTDLPLPKPAPSTHAGPARANSREFLDGWERTFGGRSAAVGQA